ncbi:hypothetical protein [Streptomyces sp. CdTB01]|uniref:hypothetical protein n=1 Tax=Streptomyces sp. CdTB01 TaxID=1725411 RepID=UPI00099E578C|nr:hypothetical protein [Streptomyces sp. CdTB01]
MGDVAALLPLLDKMLAVAAVVGRSRRRSGMLLADRGFEHDRYRRFLRRRGIRLAIAEGGRPHGTGLGIFCWVVGRTISSLHGLRRLRMRCKRRDDIREVFLGLAVCLIPTGTSRGFGRASYRDSSPDVAPVRCRNSNHA